MAATNIRLYIGLLLINMVCSVLLNRFHCPEISENFTNYPILGTTKNWELKPTAFLYGSTEILNIFIDFIKPMTCRKMIFCSSSKVEKFGDIYFDLIDRSLYCLYVSILKENERWIYDIHGAMSGEGRCIFVPYVSHGFFFPHLHTPTPNVRKGTILVKNVCLSVVSVISQKLYIVFS